MKKNFSKVMRSASLLAIGAGGTILFGGISSMMSSIKTEKGIEKMIAISKVNKEKKSEAKTSDPPGSDALIAFDNVSLESGTEWSDLEDKLDEIRKFTLILNQLFIFVPFFLFTYLFIKTTKYYDGFSYVDISTILSLTTFIASLSIYFFSVRNLKNKIRNNTYSILYGAAFIELLNKENLDPVKVKKMNIIREFSMRSVKICILGSFLGLSFTGTGIKFLLPHDETPLIPIYDAFVSQVALISLCVGVIILFCSILVIPVSKFLYSSQKAKYPKIKNLLYRYDTYTDIDRALRAIKAHEQASISH